MKMRPFVLLVGSILAWGCASPARESNNSADPLSRGRVVKVTDELHQRYKHKDDYAREFYQKAVSAGGLWIMASAKVDDRALLEARYLVLSMLKARDDLRKTLIDNDVRICVMSHDEYTNNVPEHRKMSPWWNTRARGLGGKLVSGGSENILNYRGDPYRGENILIHEFAHAVAHSGLRVLDKSFRDRLTAVFDRAKASGKFQGYGIGNHGEFWAEGVQSWFECNTAGLVLKKGADGKRKPLLNRADLRKHLPELAAIIAESFGKNEWLYTTTDKRLHLPHLKGYDREAAPQFKYPKHILDAARADGKKIQERKRQREQRKKR